MNFGMITLNQYQNDAKLCYMDTGSFTSYIKNDDFYEDIAGNIEKRFDTSNYEINRPFPTRKNKKVIGLMKDELEGKIMTEFAAFRPKAYSYFMDDGNNDKKTKGTRERIIKTILKLNDYKGCLFKNEIILKSQQRFTSKAHSVYNKEINDIALNSNDDKRLQKFDRNTSYPYDTYAGKLCKTELLEYVNIK